MHGHRRLHQPLLEPDVRRRALLLWPRLNPLRLARTRGYPVRVARLVARRTSLDPAIILGMLLRDDMNQFALIVPPEGG
jgi:hypothetical protein